MIALFLHLFPDSFFVADGFRRRAVGGGAAFAPHPGREVRAEENEEVEQGDDGQQRAHDVQPDQAAGNTQGKKGGIQPGEVFDFHGHDEQQHRGVRIEHGEGKEHGHVHIIGAGEDIVLPGEQRRQDHARQGEGHAAEIIDVELGRAPFPLQGGADKIVEEQGDDQEKGLEAGGYEDKGDQPPDLAPEQGAQVEGQKADGAVVVSGQKIQEINDRRADDDDLHQIRDPETGMAIAEFIDFSVEQIQIKTPPESRRRAPFGGGAPYKNLLYMKRKDLSLKNCKQETFYENILGKAIWDFP